MVSFDSDHEFSGIDVLITGGTLVDGTGRPSREADVWVKGNKIVKIIEPGHKVKAIKVIDAKDKVVTPGFIDIHTHVDIDSNGSNLLSDKYASNFIMQGTTTVIGGNCGMGPSHINDFLESVMAGKTSLNFGLLIGHGGVRKEVMGMDNRPPSISELKTMKLLVKRGMEEGAFGLSSGLGYAPGSYADLYEMVELCKVVKEYDGVYTSHIREQSKNVRESWEEIAKTGELSNVRVQISHVQVIGESYWGVSKDLIGVLKKARKKGITINCDGYPYESGATTIVGALIPNWAQAEGRMQERLNDPDLRMKIKKEVQTLLSLRGGSQSVLITSCPSNLSLQKQYLKDIAVNWQMTPVEAVLKIACESPEAVAIYFHSSEIDKEIFFSDPSCAVGSDSFCVANDLQENNLVHPRSYGTMPAFLMEYVRKKGLLSLEEGIRRMTSLPAEIIGVRDRGEILEGKIADLVVFDYENIHDNSSYVDAHHYPHGIEYVLVNGSVVVDEGIQQAALPGLPLYGHDWMQDKRG